LGLPPTRGSPPDQQGCGRSVALASQSIATSAISLKVPRSHWSPPDLQESGSAPSATTDRRYHRRRYEHQLSAWGDPLPGGARQAIRGVGPLKAPRRRIGVWLTDRRRRLAQVEVSRGRRAGSPGATDWHPQQSLSCKFDRNLKSSQDVESGVGTSLMDRRLA